MTIITKPVRGILIHQRVLANNQLINNYVIENLYLEYTFLFTSGKERQLFRKILIKIGLVVAFISTCRTYIIISQL